MAFRLESVWLGAMTCQASYPLNSESARPFGTLTEARSWAAVASETTRTEPATMRDAVTGRCFISDLLLECERPPNRHWTIEAAGARRALDERGHRAGIGL